jgi:hypothetical protein
MQYSKAFHRALFLQEEKLQKIKLRTYTYGVLV